MMQTIAQQTFDKISIKSVIKKMADWQIDQLSTRVDNKDLDWTHAVLYIGMLDWAELAEKEEYDDSYYQWLLRIGQRNHFQMGKSGNTMPISLLLGSHSFVFIRNMVTKI